MTIKEFASLAGVSVSTVSKIMNGKDGSIGKETREKVLSMAKEYGYAPYANILQGSSKRFLLGALLKGTKEDREFLFYISREAARYGYNVVSCFHGGSEGEEEKAVYRLIAQNVEAVVWNPMNNDGANLRSALANKEIPVYSYEGGLEEGCHLDYGTLSYEAASYLLEKKHKKIAYITLEKEHSSRFEKGIQRCFYDKQKEDGAVSYISWNIQQSIRELTIEGVTAILCETEDLGMEVLKKAREEALKIPENLSVMGLGMEDSVGLMVPALTMMILPLETIAVNICKRIICQLEEKEEEKHTPLPLRILPGETVQALSGEQQKKIVVVGGINMDVIINVEELGGHGQTVMAHSLYNIPGGKGANQAVGASRLGATVHMIGMVGQDYEGKIIRDNMLRHGIKLEGILETPLAGTGRAFITVQENGESSIVVYSGANKLLSRDDILQAQYLFEDARFCLLQLETPAHTTQLAAELASRKGAKVILKPAAAKQVEDSLLEHVDMFIPNHKELELLLPGNQSLEEKAQYFLDKGVNHVIVTLGRHGCYLRNRTTSLYVSPGDFEAVDTTGAADGFISALAVSLMEGCCMIDAIKYATFAAGISVTRPGAQPSLADLVTMDLYEDEIQKSILVREHGMF